MSKKQNWRIGLKVKPRNLDHPLAEASEWETFTVADVHPSGYCDIKSDGAVLTIVVADRNGMRIIDAADNWATIPRRALTAT